MNTYYGIRFHRPTWLVPAHVGYQEPAGSRRHGRLAISPPSVNMTRVADIATEFMDNQS